MTVQGTGDFEVKWPRCDVQGIGGSIDIGDVLVQVSEGIGRQWQSEPMSLQAFQATPTLVVPGFPGNLYRAAQACHCPPFTQLFKRNTIVRHEFTNNGSFDARVRLTYAGCFHQVPECPPGRSMDRIRSLEPTIGPILVPQRDYCPPQEELYYEPQMPEPYAAPAPYPQPMAPQPSFEQQVARSGTMQIAVPGGAMTVQQGGPLSYVSKYYQPGPGGMAMPGPQAAAHGYDPNSPYRPVTTGAWPMGGMGARPPVRRQAPPGWVLVNGEWRKVR